MGRDGTGWDGMGSRTSMVGHLPEFVGSFGGDTLWALALFLFLGCVYLNLETPKLALASLGLAFAVEASQLYHAEWIDQIRGTLPGKLLLGSGFLWSDLVCYTVGIGMGALTEYLCSPLLKRSE